MSVVIETFLICDGHCGANFGVDYRSKTAKQHREAAKLDGWYSSGSKDYCPNCKKPVKFYKT